jgi:hypothetical protein
MSTLTVKNVDEDLKREFKIACLRNDYTMSEVLIRFMKKYVAETATYTRREGNHG